MKRSLLFAKDIRSKADSTFLLYCSDETIRYAEWEKLNQLENMPGVYVIESENGDKFTYPCGENSVIYIGKSNNLRSRLNEHLSILQKLWNESDYGMKRNEPWVSRQYQYMRYSGARVHIFKCRKSTQDAKELEARFMWAFYSKYRSLPVGNSAKSYSTKD